MTRFETEEWDVTADATLRIFETEFGRLAIAICYDVEFPEIARAAARQGAHILVVPSCTDDRQGFWRVRYCAHARAIENQLYVIHSGTVGSLPMVPAVSLNYGQASILTPSDFAFSRDGILAEGNPNQEMMVIGELNLETICESRSSGHGAAAARQRPHPGAGGGAGDGAPVSAAARRGRWCAPPARGTSPGSWSCAARSTRARRPGRPSSSPRTCTSFPRASSWPTEEPGGAVVGMAASLIVLWDDYSITTSWRDFTDHGTVHQPRSGARAARCTAPR